MRGLQMLVLALAMLFAGPVWADDLLTFEIVNSGDEVIPGENIVFVTEDGVRVPATLRGEAYFVRYPDGFAVAGQIIVSKPGDDLAVQVFDIPIFRFRDWESVYLDMASGAVIVEGPSGSSPVTANGTATVDSATANGSAAPELSPADSGPGVFPEDLEIRARDDAAREAAARKPVVEVSGGISTQSVELPQTGTGTRISGGEHALARLDRRLTLTGFEGAVSAGVPILRGGARLGLLFSQSSGSDQASGAVAVGTDPVAITYQDFGGNGVTGVFLGAAGLDGSIHRNVDAESVEAEVRWNTSLNLGFNVQPSVIANYDRVETDIRHELMTPSYDSIYQSTRTSLEETRVGVGAGFYANYEFDENLSGEIGLHGFATQSETDFHSVQSNTCGLCGSDNNFVSMLRESDDNIDLSVRGSASVRYYVSEVFSFGIYGRVTYRDSVSGIFNPTSGDDLFLRNDTAGITREPAVEYIFKLSLTISYGDE